jgi:hypothetical protein
MWSNHTASPNCLSSHCQYYAFWPEILPCDFTKSPDERFPAQTRPWISWSNQCLCTFEKDFEETFPQIRCNLCPRELSDTLMRKNHFWAWPPDIVAGFIRYIWDGRQTLSKSWPQIRKDSNCAIEFSLAKFLTLSSRENRERRGLKRPKISINVKNQEIQLRRWNWNEFRQRERFGFDGLKLRIVNDFTQGES